MSDDLRTRIAAVLRLHQWRATVRMTDDDPVLKCTCGTAFGPHHTFDCYREHVADAVIRELGMTEFRVEHPVADAPRYEMPKDCHCGHMKHPGQRCLYRRELPGEIYECPCDDSPPTDESLTDRIAAQDEPHDTCLSNQERIDLIGRWMHPGLWSGLDSRREAILKILGGQHVEPPLAGGGRGE